ncbi:MAG: response regulator [Vicinamibacteria bacterium]
MPRHRLLLVDDEEPIVFAMSRYFATQGFDVDSACTLADACARVDAAAYAAVVADLRLSGHRGEEGLDLLTYVRRNAAGTRSVLLTAYSSPEIEAAALSRGVDLVLRKPIPLPDLARSLLGLLEDAG